MMKEADRLKLYKDLDPEKARQLSDSTNKAKRDFCFFTLGSAGYRIHLLRLYPYLKQAHAFVEHYRCTKLFRQNFIPLKEIIKAEIVFLNFKKGSVSVPHSCLVLQF